MKEFFKKFFSDSNKINENTVVGTILLIPFIAATFFDIVGPDKYYVLAGLTAACFCIQIGKKRDGE